MKEFKKSPRQQLEKFSTIFMQLGLVLVLFIVFVSLEHETEQTAVIVQPRTENYIETVNFNTRPIVYVKEVDKKPVAKQKKVVTTKIDNPIVVDNSHDDATIINTPVEDNEPLINVLPEVPEDEVINKEDDPTPMRITFVSKIPVFAGCENLSEKEGRKCFDKKINKLIRKHFDTDLANELGLRQGKNKILTQFVIDKQGNITDVKIRAPHARLKKETQRIINKIPVFTPGENQGKPVNVRYTLPINFQVE